MKQRRMLVVGFLILVGCSCIGRAESYSRLLSVADVEKLTNLRGVTMKEEATVLHFYRKDGKEIASVRFEDRSIFKKYSNDKAKYRALLPSIAMESVSGVPRMPYQIVFLTKQQTVIVSTFHKISFETILPFPQLLSIARLLGSRMQPT